MRGTLHLVPSADLPLYTAAMRGRWMKTRNSWLKYLRMTEAELKDLVEDIGDALDGSPMTRDEILARIGSGRPDHVREMLRSGWGSTLKPVARNGMLCFGPSRGQNVTFVNPRQWLGTWREIDPDNAIAEIAKRYLRAYGPATRVDFARWWGNWPGVGQAAWSGLAGELSSVSVEGERADLLTTDLPALRKASVERSVVLLPPFDPYLMGHSSRGHLFETTHASKVSRTAGWISAVVLVDGRVEGTWTHTIAGKRMKLVVAPFRRLPSWVVSEVQDRAQPLAAAAGLTGGEVKISAPGRS
jgi:hypothetical protein